MKIVNIIGGLGNQMFQYAFAIALQEIFKEEVKVDTHHYHYLYSKYFHGNNFYHNGYEIDKIFPNAVFKKASICDILKFSYYIPNFALSRIVRRFFPSRKYEFIQKSINSYTFNSNILTNNRYKYYEGYWMSPLYFEKIRSIILEKFSFRPFNTEENIKYKNLILKENSVTIHIRRGDYVGSSNLGGICTLYYYRNAIREARKMIINPVFFIFSNDPKWCMDNLESEFEGSEVHFVTQNKGDECYRDMQLMSLARCNILANSSFSWWGAYLNQRDNHITFCPNKWHNTMDCSDHYVNEWIKISIK